MFEDFHKKTKSKEMNGNKNQTMDEESTRGFYKYLTRANNELFQHETLV